MTNSQREILEGLQGQGIDEEITYTLTIPTSWGTPAAPLTVKAYSVNETTGALTDVTSTVLPTGSGSIASQVITLPEMKALTVDVLYRVEVKFATGTDIKEAFGYVRGEQ